MKTVILSILAAALVILAALWLADVEPCGVPSCFCGCRQKDPCRCAE